MNHYLENIAGRSAGIESGDLALPLLLPDKLQSFSTTPIWSEEERLSESVNPGIVDVGTNDFTRKEATTLTNDGPVRNAQTSQGNEKKLPSYIEAQVQRHNSLPVYDSSQFERKAVDVTDNSDKTAPLQTATTYPMAADMLPNDRQVIQLADNIDKPFKSKEEKPEPVLPQQKPLAMNVLPAPLATTAKTENYYYNQIMPAEEKQPSAFTKPDNHPATKLVIGRITVEVINPPKQVMPPTEKIIIRKQETRVQVADNVGSNKFYFGLKQL